VLGALGLPAAALLRTGVSALLWLAMSMGGVGGVWRGWEVDGESEEAEVEGLCGCACERWFVRRLGWRCTGFCAVHGLRKAKCSGQDKEIGYFLFQIT